MKSSWRSPDGGSSVARNTKIEPCGAVFCAWWGTGSTPIRSFHTVSLGTSVNRSPADVPEAAGWHHARVGPPQKRELARRRPHVDPGEHGLGPPVLSGTSRGRPGCDGGDDGPGFISHP